MARRPRYVPVNVYLNNRLVGPLRGDLVRAIAFQYDGDNRHYIMKTIAARNFIETANRAGTSKEVVVSILDELRGTV
jgi:hypothetical protein